MVPPEKIDNEQPTTLPADFGEWDSGEDSAAEPAAPSGAERAAGPGGASRPSAQASVASVAVLPLPVAGRSTSGTARSQAAAYTYVEPAYQPSQAKAGGSRYEEIEDAGSHGHKKAVTLGAIGAVVVLLVAGTLGYVKLRPKTDVPNQASSAQTTTLTNAEKPSTDNTAQTANTVASANTPAVETAAPTIPLRAQSDAMNKQLNAPSRISNDLKALTGKEAPPPASFSSGGVEGLGSGGQFLSGQGGPKVKVLAAKKASISAGVAVGLLVQKTAPVYPPLAKAAHVSGTVVIQATISKTGGVGNLRAVSGPKMLQQAALDAVRNWRFRPYLLDGEPVETDTTVNVTFALAQ